MLKREKWSGPNPDAVFHRKFEGHIGADREETGASEKKKFSKDRSGYRRNCGSLRSFVPGGVRSKPCLGVEPACCRKYF